MHRQWLLGIALIALATAARAELPKDAVVLDSDLVWDPVSVESAAVSPDGQLIAYVSKGAIWSCKVTAGPPTKLADLPDTITAFLSMPEHQAGSGEICVRDPQRRLYTNTGTTRPDRTAVQSGVDTFPGRCGVYAATMEI